MRLPRYPIFIPSKGRYQPERALTARWLDADGVPFQMVVEPPERRQYEKLVGKDRVLVLPFHDLGMGSIPARNWLKQQSIERGDVRHWQLDDNIVSFERRAETKRYDCVSGPALAAVEDLTDRYENVAIAGIDYKTFGWSRQTPFSVNVHVYSCSLILNAIPYQWRGRYNEDTDICLQALAGGWCTLLVHVFTVDKATTMTIKGGNTDDLYQGDGRLTMARSLERVWPGVVRVDRRWGRPQHVVNWRKFKTPLKLRADVDLSKIEPDEYGLALVDRPRTELRPNRLGPG